ncbi:MAG: hypothetical protein ABL908_06570 [Hyphomicrobium sp.]
MDEDAARAKRTALDVALADVHPNVVISFGVGLFRAFAERKWITWETFGVLGTGLFAGTAPAYQKTHIVLPSTDLSFDDFRIGI